MKKFFALLTILALPFLLAACGAEQGDYTPGVYFGYSEGHRNSFAVLTINQNGVIESLLVDSVYTTSGENSISITKRTLDGGCGYDMHRAAVNCEVEGKLMWHQQVNAIAAAVVENQGLPDWNVGEDNKMDDLAGVSITVDSYITAIQNALSQARP